MTRTFAYDDPCSRVELSYRMLLPRLPARILWVTNRQTREPSPWATGGFVDAHVVHDLDEFVSRRSNERFDAVLLHEVIADCGRASHAGLLRDPRRGMLECARGLLVPGGLIAGTVPNLLHRLDPQPAWSRRTTAGRCFRLLREAGYHDLRCHLVLPCASAPRSLVDVGSRPMEHFFSEQLERQRGEISGLSWLARRALTWTGLARLVYGSILFSGRTP